ncbi:hypothetical protein [Candidatus Symbiobacter mobilis]|uniref:hypothetical protein n=1 Tax=Candidatus Symbiobacter mobilis TaxID=1436290 RepID=UPI00059CF723|nr:hypothetical protein [Candidatus Symbiobacter mobilis]
MKKADIFLDKHRNTKEQISIFVIGMVWVMDARRVVITKYLRSFQKRNTMHGYQAKDIVVERADLLNCPLRTSTVGGVGAGS